MQAATGEQAPGVFLHIISDELVYTVGKANDLGRDIVDEGSAFDSRCVKMFKEGFGRTAEFNDLIVIRPPAFHQLKRVRFEHFERLNVDMAVSNHVVGRWSLVVDLEHRELHVW